MASNYALPRTIYIAKNELYLRRSQNNFAVFLLYIYIDGNGISPW